MNVSCEYIPERKHECPVLICVDDFRMNITLNFFKVLLLETIMDAGHGKKFDLQNGLTFMCSSELQVLGIDYVDNKGGFCFEFSAEDLMKIYNELVKKVPGEIH